MTIQVTIIGLGQVGASIGLALGEHKDAIRRLGHDREPAVAKQADKMGVVDQVGFNLPAAVRQADVVVLAEPADLAQQTLRLINPDLKPGAVVLDITLPKVSMQKLAAELLQEDRHYVSLTPTLNPNYLHETGAGIDTAHADLFQNSLVMITAPAGANPEAVKLASDFSALLGARPFFSDPYELDGLLATTSLLPQLAAVALVNAAVDKPGWREARKLAGKHFSAVSSPLDTPVGVEDPGMVFLQNRENTLRVLDDYLVELENLRAALAEGDDQALKARLEKASQAREKWLAERRAGRWEHGELPQAEYPGAKEFFSRLIGLRPRNRVDEKRK